MAKAGSIFRRLWLLLWKNLILRKRQYIVTSLEIILPTLFAIMMAYVRTKISSGDQGGSYSSYSSSYSSMEYFEEDMIRNARGYSNITMAFVPNDANTNELVLRVGKALFAGSYSEYNVTWSGFSNEAEMESFVAQYGLDNSDYNRPQLLGALVFNGLNKPYPDNHRISYKIRIIDRFYDTTELMPWSVTSGPNYVNENQYLYAGFAGLQLIIDKLLTEELTGFVPTYNLSIQTFPYPATEDLDFDSIYYLLLPQLLVLGFTFIIPSTVGGIVSEKETGIKELMKMTGLPNWMHWVGWMMNSLIVLLFTITVVIILFFVSFSSASGAVLKHSDPTLWWFVLFIYAIWATSYCFLISSVFERPTVAITVGIVIWLVSYNGAALPLESGYVNLALSTKLIICLCPNMALHYALKVMCAFESRGVGAQWSNIGDPVNSIDSLTLGYVLMMFVVDIILYMLVAMYLEKIIPTKYGVRKPWYFIFMPSEWGCGRKGDSSEDISDLRRSALEAEESDRFEKVPDGFKVGMEVLKLRKEFGPDKVAVDDVSLKIYEGQIFCLLGHNGAGKTTMMSILTGLLGQTSGTAIIDGKDMRTDMDEIRQSLGLCPQHNLLFSKLTVREHLKFFGMVKGLTSSEAESQLPDLIRKLQLSEKENSLSSSLSGGQKRKLNLGCSIIGGSKVLFLDECSSGLDPEARRVIWDLLLEIRGERTIVLTTHSLEEADVLGDRIAIMASGKVQCCGSPMFLKKYYGAGYTLSLTLHPGGKPNQVLETIKSHVPSAFIKSHSEGSHLIELSITLPSENNNSSNFPSMFSELLARKSELRVQDVGISLTTMDEVFIKVDELSHVGASSSSGNGVNVNSNGSFNHSTKSTGLSLVVIQFWGLFLKKMLYSLKRWKLFLSQMVIPVALLIAAILINNTSYNQKDKLPPLKMSLSSYKDPVTLYSITPEMSNLSRIFESIVGPSASKIPSGSKISTELNNVGISQREKYNERYIVAAEFNNDLKIKSMYSTIPPHSCPLAMNLVANTMLRDASPENKHFTIEVTNHPLSSQSQSIYSATRQDSVTTDIMPAVVGLLLGIGLSLLAGSFIILPIEERICQSKQLQLMSGVNPIVYWGSSFLWDYFVLFICVAVLTACFPIFEKYGNFTSNGGLGVILLVMVVYGIGAISFSYLFSLFAQTVAGGFSLVTSINFLTGIGMSLGAFVLELDGSPTTLSIATTISWIGRLFPTFGLAKSAMVYAKTSSANSQCKAMTRDVLDILCSSDFDGWDKETMQACCPNCEALGAKCFEPKPYLVWSIKKENFYSRDTYTYTPGIGLELVCMMVISLVYVVILILVELGYVKRLLNKVLKQKDMTFKSNSDDTDVQTETDRVKSLIQTGKTSEDAVIVDNLSKSFGSFSAVSKLTFGVHHGECFGLLGVNGAGKTTSFRMLTGDEIISNGNAFMNMHSLQNDRKTFLSSIGYCPQFDGIIGVLSGKDMLELFARLRGIESSAVAAEAQKWLNRMGLAESGKVQCQKYSGGMKRRLSAAMAMIGDPPVVFLDEPTSGVDAVSRRQFWNIISSLRDSGQAIILTSHSMEECEFLCSRLGIMVNGELQCLGGVQHLKNKFAQGYSLIVRLKPEALQTPDGIAALANEVIRQFYPCSIKDHHQNTMQFHIESTSMQWDELFKRMESIKSTFHQFIDEYSVSQTSLEEVFLSFARKQYDNQRQVQTSLFRKGLNGLFGC